MSCKIKSTNNVADCCLPLQDVTWLLTDANGNTVITISGLANDSANNPSTFFVGGILDEPEVDFDKLIGTPSPVTLSKTITDLCGNVDTYTQEFEADPVTTQFNIDTCDNNTFTCEELDSCSITNLGDVNVDTTNVNEGDLLVFSGGTWINQSPVMDVFVTGTTLSGATIIFADNSPTTPDFNVEFTSTGNTVNITPIGNTLNLESVTEFECDDLSGCTLFNLQVSGETNSIVNYGDTINIQSSDPTILITQTGTTINFDTYFSGCTNQKGDVLSGGTYSEIICNLFQYNDGLQDTNTLDYVFYISNETCPNPIFSNPIDNSTILNHLTTLGYNVSFTTGTNLKVVYEDCTINFYQSGNTVNTWSYFVETSSTFCNPIDLKSLGITNPNDTVNINTVINNSDCLEGTKYYYCDNVTITELRDITVGGGGNFFTLDDGNNNLVVTQQYDFYNSGTLVSTNTINAFNSGAYTTSPTLGLVDQIEYTEVIEQCYVYEKQPDGTGFLIEKPQTLISGGNGSTDYIDNITPNTSGLTVTSQGNAFSGDVDFSNINISTFNNDVNYVSGITSSGNTIDITQNNGVYNLEYKDCDSEGGIYWVYDNDTGNQKLVGWVEAPYSNCNVSINISWLDKNSNPVGTPYVELVPFDSVPPLPATGFVNATNFEIVCPTDAIYAITSLAVTCPDCGFNLIFQETLQQNNSYRRENQQISICEFLRQSDIVDTSSGKVNMIIPSHLNGMYITKIYIKANSGSGNSTVLIKSNTTTVLSKTITNIVCDINTLATPYEINECDNIYIETTNTTGTLKGLTVTIELEDIV